MLISLTPTLVSLLSIMKVKVAQLSLSLCDPMDYTVHGTLQAGILECVTFPFSRGSSQPRDRAQVSCIVGDSLPTERIRDDHYYTEGRMIWKLNLSESQLLHL